ncbi:GNAT family N-acetyltransferase [Vibrio cincinnatiensis]|uniref:GNAT family N-acetyltransferase n=1 Tax=Vibrio cincinnatiensis TaxID=675 RepID=UPI00130280E7|nr:GNAT family N-acetyltransferase [Vibrio cincinnatiensis]MCG3723981.1 GNAT family N-acetyltransferase [Vibrio cincinnatiensis]
MPTLHFEQIQALKLPLIKRFYKQHCPAAKPKSDELIIAAYQQEQIKAVVRFRTIAGSRLLTGMAVASTNRGQGIGYQLLIYCKEHIMKHMDYCFAYPHLTSFYGKGNFRILSLEQLPAELQLLLQRYQANGKDLIPMQYIEGLY